MIPRRTFLAGTGAIILAAPLAAEGQQSHVPRVGVLYPESHRCVSAFRQGLIDLGYVEGRNVAFEYRPGGSIEQNIEQTGLGASLARSGGNITGISLPIQALAGKRLEIIKAAVPAADRIAPAHSGQRSG